MTQTAQSGSEPPKLVQSPSGKIETASLADLLEFFLQNDQRVAIVRHPHVEELFQWKRSDDIEHGVEPAPFENAEARFAIGVIQAVGENDTEQKLGKWITDVLQALGEAKQNNEDLARSYNLSQEKSHVEQAKSLPSKTERRSYLTSCWIESLCTAEVRFLGWVYQKIYGKPFEPKI